MNAVMNGRMECGLVFFGVIRFWTFSGVDRASRGIRGTRSRFPFFWIFVTMK